MSKRSVRFWISSFLLSSIAIAVGCGEGKEAIKPEKFEPRPPSDNSSPVESKEVLKKNSSVD